MIATFACVSITACTPQERAPLVASASSPALQPVTAAQPASPSAPAQPGASRAPVFNAPSPTAAPWRWRQTDVPGFVRTDQPHEAALPDGGQVRLLIPIERAGVAPRPRLERRDAAGQVVWSHTFEAGPLMGAGEVVATSDRVVVVLHSRIASGAEAFGFGLDGGLVWRAPLVGLGPVDHSKYANQVQARVVPGTDRIWFYGRESQGGYVEARSLRAGTLLSNRTLTTAELELDTALRELSWQAPASRPSGEAQVFTFGDDVEVVLRPVSAADGAPYEIERREGARQVWHRRGACAPGAVVRGVADHERVYVVCDGSDPSVSAWDVREGVSTWARAGVGEGARRSVPRAQRTPLSLSTRHGALIVQSVAGGWAEALEPGTGALRVRMSRAVRPLLLVE